MNYRFITTAAPTNEVRLIGRSGQPLTLSLSDGISAKTVQLGDGDTFEIISTFKTERIVGFSGAEADSYAELCEKARSLAGIELPEGAVFVFFDTCDGFIPRRFLHRILRACLCCNAELVRSKNRVVWPGLDDIEDFTGIDGEILSRVTRNDLIRSAAGNFSLQERDALFYEEDPDEVIVSERLVIRPLKEKDALDVLEILRDADSVYPPGVSEMDRLEDAVKYVDNVSQYAVVLGDEVIGLIEEYSDGELVDDASFLGYFLKKRYWNQGYMTEALNAFKERYTGREYPMLWIFPENDASRRVAEKCGWYRMEGSYLRDIGGFKTFVDFYLYDVEQRDNGSKWKEECPR